MPTANDWVEMCRHSRSKRLSTYRELRTWYLLGTGGDGDPAAFNKLLPHIQLLNSYLYGPTQVMYQVAYPAHSLATWQLASEATRAAFAEYWRDSGADMLFTQLTEWSLVYGTMLAKIIRTGHGPGDVMIAPIDPGHFGVAREDVPMLDEQEAFCHWFALSEDQVKVMTDHLSADVKDRIRQKAHEIAHPGPQEDDVAQGVSNLIATSVADGRVTGVASSLLRDVTWESPEVAQPVIPACELWEKVRFKKDGRIKQDWDVTTLIADEPVFTRRNPTIPFTESLPAELPFVAIRPNPLPDMFWGRSEIAPLLRLQELREHFLGEVKMQIEKAIRPNSLVSGVGLADEKLRQAFSPGGEGFLTAMPGARMDVNKFDLPTDPYAILYPIDQMFNEASGMPELLQGQTGANMRAGDQVNALSRLAVGRVRQKALIVQDALEVLSTRFFHLIQRLDNTIYRMEETKEEFLLSQLPAETQIKVSAHSSSPIYADEIAGKALQLFDKGAIDIPTLVELLNPPMAEALRERAKVLAKNKADVAERILKLKEEQARKGRSR